jgi:hypothetical protein
VDFEEFFDRPEEEKPRDPAIDLARDHLKQLFEESPARLYYSTQIETSCERKFFHWITGKALLELANEKQIQRLTVRIQEQGINFYASRKHRYIQRELKVMRRVLERLFDPEFTHAIGRHGELMFDAALGRFGFRAEAKNVTSWQGRSWIETAHNLDRIITRDGIAYGVEIKNTQNYISRGELLVKIRMCQHLQLTPLFIMRFAPKSYVYDVYKSGGFTLLFENQFYPWGHGNLLEDARVRLGLKVQGAPDHPLILNDLHQRSCELYREFTNERPLVSLFLARSLCFQNPG